MEKMGSKEGCDSARRLLRRKSRKRKPTQDCVINMAEVRREVAHALHLHRSSSSSSAYASNAFMLDSSTGNRYVTEQPSFVASNSHQYYCYSLTNTLPTPEPVWSTTAPSVLAVSPPTFESRQFEVGENQAAAASYSWWIGFLRNLDGNGTEVVKNQWADYNHNNKVMGCSLVSGEPLDPLETSDLSSCTDDWFNVSNC